MPAEYWTRPIEGENTYWYSTASNWLSTPYVIGAGASYGIPGAVQPDGSAPNSAHVMWTKANSVGWSSRRKQHRILQEKCTTAGLSYNTRFGNPIIMQGTLYYQEPWGNAGGSGGLFGTGGDYVAVDLQTGKEVWRINPAAQAQCSYHRSATYIHTKTPTNMEYCQTASLSHLTQLEEHQVPTE